MVAIGCYGEVFSSCFTITAIEVAVGIKHSQLVVGFDIALFGSLDETLLGLLIIHSSHCFLAVNYKLRYSCAVAIRIRSSLNYGLGFRINHRCRSWCRSRFSCWLIESNHAVLVFLGSRCGKLPIAPAIVVARCYHGRSLTLSVVFYYSLTFYVQGYIVRQFAKGGTSARLLHLV